jgi:hypothetical protein
VADFAVEEAVEPAIVSDLEVVESDIRVFGLEAAGMYNQMFDLESVLNTVDWDSFQCWDRLDLMSSQDKVWKIQECRLHRVTASASGGPHPTLASSQLSA